MLHYALFEFKITTKHLTPHTFISTLFTVISTLPHCALHEIKETTTVLSILNIYLFFPFLDYAPLELRRRLVSIFRISLVSFLIKLSSASS